VSGIREGSNGRSVLIGANGSDARLTWTRGCGVEAAAVFGVDVRMGLGVDMGVRTAAPCGGEELFGDAITEALRLTPHCWLLRGGTITARAITCARWLCKIEACSCGLADRNLAYSAGDMPSMRWNFSLSLMLLLMAVVAGGLARRC